MKLTALFILMITCFKDCQTLAGMLYITFFDM